MDIHGVAPPEAAVDDRAAAAALVHSKDDAVLPWEPNTGRAAALIDDAVVTLYDTVTWQGHQFMGHWSWIYVARNDPQHNGQHVWQWMAQQHR
ncbi:hypothetical protein GCM10025789_28840 [Tessaracoccus lubricantis]|uniref:Uncharacterized protein n=1 Tax=Tessaracoccus lubricantis TaxID=545543 RepID=A0ABP9FL60_9ACTN